MAGKLTDKQFSRLDASIVWSNRMLEFPKRKRIEAIRQFVGFHYSNEGGPNYRNPVNILALELSIYARLLCPQSPRALISTIKKDRRPLAANLELAINKIPDEIGLDNTLRRFVIEALFSIGVLKVGLHKVGTALVMICVYMRYKVYMLSIVDGGGEALSLRWSS